MSIMPLAEQRRIVAEVERRLSVIDELETLAEANLKRAGRLRQAILKRAFEGKLVPQDPSDEPASVLLQRIRRQHPIGSLVADFCCPQRGLVVELDGSVHAQPSQARTDTRRDRALKEAGYTVLRLPNGMVLEDPEAFVRKVVERAEGLPNFYTGEP